VRKLVAIKAAILRTTGPRLNDISEMSLEKLRRMMAAHGVTQLLVKELAANDNSKNQPYLGGSLDILNVLPMGEVRSETTDSGRKGLKAPLPLSWLRADGSLTVAAGAQLILYPQYPEIRMSGFLRGTRGGPNALMTARTPRRLLFFGITSDRRIIGWVTAPGSTLAREIDALGRMPETGVLRHVPMGTADTSRNRLLARLRNIHRMGWVDSQRLLAPGNLGPCAGTNCGGYTLEAQFGISPNGRAEPDFEGWEIKGHSVRDFVRFSSGPLTLMTPEPGGGYYREKGPEAFVRKYGYVDKRGRTDRYNFGGVHVLGRKHASTGLTLQFLGYDPVTNRIVDPNGGFALMDSKGNEAATWYFAGLIAHWNRKHAKAVYVPYLLRSLPSQQYTYGALVRMGEGTDFIRFLKALADGKVYYDPGIKVERASTTHPLVKRRSQFRMRSQELGNLYAKFESHRLAP
jgi:hypothetical protein